MEASVVDLRYKMKDVLKALHHHERVKILYHGKVQGTIFPAENPARQKVSDHAFFGMMKNATDPVPVIMDKLRDRRFDAF